MSTPQPAVALVSRSESRTILPDNWHWYPSLDALLDNEPTDVVILDMAADRAGKALTQLRAMPDYRYQLIYLVREGNALADMLSDGPVPDEAENLVPLWRLWRQRMTVFNNGVPPERFEERVMAWLWPRSRAEIAPVRDSRKSQHYTYPLLDALADDEPINIAVWLQLMTQQGWLESMQLVDRLRLCTSCGSGHLNYVDVCPECSALEIVRQPSLHCFTCGHVAPQEHFLKGDILMCPNCLSRLRHIGSDYDRPLENFRCRSCQAFFVDAEVEARCLDCNASHNPADLRIREIRHYRLGETGRLRCRQGLKEAPQTERFGRLNLVGANTFRGLLDWEMQQLRRYGEPASSLVVVRFVNLSETLHAMGDSRGTALVDSLVERIQETIRDTDRCTRTQEEFLWLLLPRTDFSGMNTLKQRLNSLTELFPASDDYPLEVRTAGFTLPDQLLSDEDSKLLMARLASEVG